MEIGWIFARCSADPPNGDLAVEVPVLDKWARDDGQGQLAAGTVDVESECLAGALAHDGDDVQEALHRPAIDSEDGVVRLESGFRCGRTGLDLAKLRSGRLIA